MRKRIPGCVGRLSCNRKLFFIASCCLWQTVCVTYFKRTGQSSIRRVFHCPDVSVHCHANTVVFNAALIAFSYENLTYTNHVDVLDEEYNHLLLVYRRATSWWGAGNIESVFLNSRTLKPILESHRTLFQVSMREDPRLFVHRKSLYMSYTLWGTGASGTNACAFCENIAFRHFREHVVWQRVAISSLAQNGAVGAIKDIVPFVGGNRNLEVAAKWEKNWGFFEYQEILYCLYSIQPFEIYRLDSFPPSDTAPAGTLIISYKWKVPHTLPNSLRGGAPPVLVGSMWYAFVHSASPWPSGGSRRRPYYSMYVITFHLNLTMYQFTPHPLLSRRGPHIYFPCGVVYVDSQYGFLVSFGVDDSSIELQFFNLSDVERVLYPADASE